MASHMEIRPADDSLALTLAEAAYSKAGMHATYLTGTIAVDNGDGSQTWLGGGAAEPMPGTGGLIPFVGDTTPPGRPIGVSATSSLEVACARWDGELEGGIPADFDHVELFAKPDSTGETVDLGALRGRGEITTGILPVGDVVEIWAIAYDCAHDANGLSAPNASEESDHATIIIAPVVSQKDLNAAADEILAAAKTDADGQIKKVSDGLDAANKRIDANTDAADALQKQQKQLSDDLDRKSSEILAAAKKDTSDQVGQVSSDLEQARKDIDANAKTFTGTVRGATIIGSEFRDSEDPRAAHVKINASGMYLGNGLAYSVSTGTLNIKGAVQSGGAISGGTITGATVQTTSKDKRGIKLTNGGLTAYDTAGNPTVAIGTDGTATFKGKVESSTFNGGTITGAVIIGSEFRTGTDPATSKVKINANGMKLGSKLSYDATTGTLWMKGDIQSGSTIGAVTITGATVQTSSDRTTTDADGTTKTIHVGVKMTAGGIVAYDQAGNAKLAIKTDGSITMDGPILTNGRITAPILEGGVINGGVITGTKIQSNTSEKTGFKLTGGALDFWDEKGENTVHLNGKANTLAGSFATALSGPRLEMRNTTTEGGSVCGLLECYDASSTAWYVQGQSRGFNTSQPDPGAYRRLNIGINPDNSELSVVRYNSGASRVVMEAGRVDINGTDGWAQQVGGLGVYVNNVRIDPVIYTDLNDWFVPASGWTAYCGDSGKDPRSHMTVIGNTCYMQLELQRADRKNVTFQSGDYWDIGYFKTEFIPKIGLNVPCIFNNGLYGGAFVPGNTSPSNTTGINGDGNYLRGHLHVGVRQTNDAWWVSVFMMYTL